MKEIGAIFVVSTSEIRMVQLAAIKHRYSSLCISVKGVQENLFNNKEFL